MKKSLSFLIFSLLLLTPIYTYADETDDFLNDIFGGDTSIDETVLPEAPADQGTTPPQEEEVVMDVTPGANDVGSLNSASEEVLVDETTKNMGGDEGVEMNGIQITKMPTTGAAEMFLLLFSFVLAGIIIFKRRKQN